MTLHRPFPPDPARLYPDPWADAADDRLSRLIEAGLLGGCCEGDLLALMPSLDRAPRGGQDGPGWLRRVLGI